MDNHYNCIYMYINKINGHKYVGQAKNFNKIGIILNKPVKNCQSVK